MAGEALSLWLGSAAGPAGESLFLLSPQALEGTLRGDESPHAYAAINLGSNAD
jgi:hypothetical protein